MFNTAPGVEIPFPEKIEEGFKRYDYGFSCNISFEKLEPLFNEFCDKLEEPLHMALHVPLSSYEEAKLQNKENVEPVPHDKVMYLKGFSKDRLDLIMQAYGGILMRDGMSQLAVVSSVSKDEIFIRKYKIVAIRSKEPDKYIPLLNKYGIEEKESLITVWDTISPEHPGKRRRISVKGKDIYHVVRMLEKQGLSAGEIIET